MPLTPAQRRTLKARAHALSPVVMIGAQGLTAAVLKEVDANLKSHELIKIHVAGEDRESRDALMDEICAAANAEPVQSIGRMLVVYRQRPDDGTVEKKSAQRPPQKRKPKRALKRTFQHEK